MGFFDKLFDIIDEAKSDAIADSKKIKGGAFPTSLKEQAYRAYKNSSEEVRKSFDENEILHSNYRERYENEKKK